MDLPPQYDPQAVEPRIYEMWEQGGYFHAEVSQGRPRFCLSMPPPNVTGILHMGHVLDNTPQDIVVRFRRMQGRVTCWVPGTDHAGIATQHMVEKALVAEGTSRHNLGREAFVQRVWEWRERFGSRIIEQLKRLGCSCDWDRTRFTMDDGLSRAVREVFFRLYARDLIYRGKYIVNWCPGCRTALADDEVEHEEVRGTLTTIRYPLKDRKGHIAVATTRVETMLGDTAVAVHPTDGRYGDWIGASVILPLVGRELPVLADSFVDPKFGTGAVKVTPAHDPNDFLIGRRHDLPQVNILHPDATLNENVPEAYRGLDRWEARRKVTEDLDAQGLIVKVEDHVHAVGHCYRCNTVVEPYLSDQWFVRMKPLAKPAAEAARKGDLRIFPSRWKTDYLRWMDEIRDWCISRQLWWGHRIPVWYCDTCAASDAVGRQEFEGVVLDRETGILCARQDLDACPACGNASLRRDPDVLDTWFSSWLWPFSTLGWPDDTPEMKYFYPTDALNSGKDILFFWDARMVMAGLEFTGRLPFRDLFLHGIARDEQNRKLSKTLGNSPDPIDLIDRYGADALRFGIMANTPMGSDVVLGERIYLAGRNFVNKLWNASRFCLGALERWRDRPGGTGDPAFEDRWILGRLAQTVLATTEDLDGYRFGEAAVRLHRFFWGDFCDWYVEMVKPRLYREEGTGAELDDGRRAARTVRQVLLAILRLLHPFVPFVTEAIWQEMRDLEGERTDLPPVLITADWPKAAEGATDTAVEEECTILQGLIRGVRDIRGKMNIPPRKGLHVVVDVPTEAWVGRIQAHGDRIASMAFVEDIRFRHGASEAPPGSAREVVADFRLYVLLEGVIDLAAERKRLDGRLTKVQRQLDTVRRKLSSESFLDRAPEDVVQRERDLLQELDRQEEALREGLEALPPESGQDFPFEG